MLSRDARITGLAFGVTAVGFEIDGKPVDAELIDPPVKGSSGAVVLEGRAPSASDELALGTETLRELHLRVGSRVTAGVVGGPRLPMHVVGRVVVEPASGSAQPGTGFANELRLGHGVLATYSGIAARDPAAVPPAEAFLRFARHVGAQAAAAQLAPTIGRDVVPTAFTPPRNLIAFARVENLPWVLSGVLGAVALVTLAHILLVSITRRRRDLAILKTLGLVGTDVMAAVVWQALLLAGVAVVVSAVIGVSGGRWLWDFLLRGVGIVADPRWSPAVLAVSELSVLVVAFTIALVPAWLAARVRPARILRTE
jgi:predicted lysophospholipase L1 biosynthesis ABC-type transport system permease subunit